MRAPDFWDRRTVLSTILLPLSALYGWVVRLKAMRAKPYRASIPVICVGNLVAGGAGKTPVALALLGELTSRGRRPHVLTRGYGGRLAGPVLVDAARHDYRDVGDEALLLAAVASTWVAHDRAAGAKAAIAAGADILVLDDGFQNHALYQDLALVVVDGAYGFGNGRLMPAGPLREPLAMGFARAHAVVVIGAGRPQLPETSLPVLRGTLLPDPTDMMWHGRRVVAFAGIGRPAKFFGTLRTLGAEIVASFSFADHHPYRSDDLAPLITRGTEEAAVVVTTTKDGVRLPAEFRELIETLPVSLVWGEPDDVAAIGNLIDRVMMPNL